MLYKEIMLSRNNLEIPLFYDGTPSASKYNPLKEAELFAENSSQSEIYLVYGIAGGFHIEALHKRFPDSKIIAFEKDRESFDFCMKLQKVKNLSANGKILFTYADELKNILIANYIPSLYGNICILKLRSWINKTQDDEEKNEKIISESIDAVSSDYSVQCHFGKIWQKNIVSNLKLLSECKENDFSEFNSLVKNSLHKTAAVIAAGPSLDDTIKTIIQNRKEYFVIATDTSYGALIKHDVIPEVTVSIDGQQISKTHFYCSKNHSEKNNTLFVFDLCASNDAIKHLISKGHSIYFVRSGHPLCEAADNNNSFPKIEAGAGTVTIAAFDFAYRLGFNKFQFFGADFCYNNGKAYTAGTYLDTNLFLDTNRFCTQEFNFDALMFRTELFPSEEFLFSKKLKSAYSSEILKKYSNTLQNYILCRNGNIEDSFVYFTNNRNKEILKSQKFDFSSFILHVKNLSEEAEDDSEKIFPFLPYFAWYRRAVNAGEEIGNLIEIENKIFAGYI